MPRFFALRPLALLICLGLPLVGTLPLRAEVTLPQAATGEARLAALHEIFQIAPLLEVLQAEGLSYGADLDADMLGGQGGALWQGKVAAVYDVARMRAIYDREMLVELGGDPAALSGIEAFFAGDLGQRVMALEVAARRALLDEAAEAAAQQAFEEVEAEGGERLAGLRDFVAVNDLIESNVMGALNANLGFYRGLAATGALGAAMSEDEMLAEVWAAEADVRAETEAWLYPFLNLAYQPLTEAELRDYVEFSRSAAGQRLNRAMFVAFDAMFTAISRDLGEALGRELQGQVL
jgi:hypothetical protein